MLYVYEGVSNWVVTIQDDLQLVDCIDPVPLTLHHQIQMAKGTVGFLVLTDTDWSNMRSSYPTLYDALYRAMYNDVPRTGLQRTMAKLRSYMNTYDSLATYYGMRNHAYIPIHGDGPHLARPWSMYRFVRLTRKFLQERNRCWEA